MKKLIFFAILAIALSGCTHSHDNVSDSTKQGFIFDSTLAVEAPEKTTQPEMKRNDSDIAEALRVVKNFFDAWNEGDSISMSDCSIIKYSPQTPNNYDLLLSETDSVHLEKVHYDPESDETAPKTYYVKGVEREFCSENIIVVIADFWVEAVDKRSADGFTHDMKYEDVQFYLIKDTESSSWLIADFILEN